MQRAAAAGADHVVDIEPYVVAWQMIGQRLAMGGPFGLLVLDPRTALMGAGEIAVEVFKPEGELVGIETLGTTAKLRALQLLDNGFQALDFAVAMLDGTPWRRQTSAMLAPGFSVSCTITRFCSSLKRRRFDRPSTAPVSSGICAACN